MKDEPDHLDFESDGLPCAMRRSRFGVWCGYVGIGQDHPWYGLPYNTLIKPTRGMLEGRSLDDTGVINILCAALSGKDPNDELEIAMALSVHGGITFADYNDDLRPGFWWFGFDCGHAGDYVPKLAASMRDGVYRNQQYVIAECQSLAAQLVKIKESFNAAPVQNRATGT